MEPVSAAASIVGIIQISSQIFTLCQEYYREVKGARRDIERLQTELQSFETVLQQLQELLESPKAARLPTSNAIKDDTIQICTRELKTVQAKLKPTGMRRFGLRSLKWPFTSKEIEQAISVIQRFKGIFDSALHVDQAIVVTGIDEKIDGAEAGRLLSKLPQASGASYKSHDQEHERYCLANTRVKLLQEISTWATAVEEKRIYWLSGMAGTGKSTVARTIAYKLDQMSTLGASYFFSRKRRGDLLGTAKFATTVALQLSQRNPILRNFICESLKQQFDLDIGLQEQWSRLIVQPFNQAQMRLNGNIVLVIDALDECEDEREVIQLLKLLASMSEVSGPKLRIFVTSRPESAIRFQFHNLPTVIYHNLALDGIDRPLVTKDIYLFILDELSRVRERHSLPSTWPKREELDAISQRSETLFIYASTVCDFIGEYSPRERLADILQQNVSGLQPTQILDALYLTILKTPLAKIRSTEESMRLSIRFKTVVGAIVTLLEPLSVLWLSELLHQQQTEQELFLRQEIHQTLDPLGALLYFPENTPIQILHPSFADFLFDKERCSDEMFWIDAKSTHLMLFHRCMQVMQASLKKDICSLRDPGSTLNDIDPDTIRRHIPLHVKYACKHWIYHFQRAAADHSEFECVSQFLGNQALFWLEVMGLLSEVPGSILSLVVLEDLCQDRKEHSTSQLVYDLRRFILANRTVLQSTPLQTYSSALIFAPSQSKTRQNYAHLIPPWLTYLPQVESRWSPCLQTLEGHTNDVTAVDVSVDGKLVASASADATVKLWDIVTGTLQKTLIGHSKSIGRVEFSPLGKFLASASRDRTVKLWEIETGRLQKTLIGFQFHMTIFSPNGELVASAEGDNAFELWDLESRVPRKSFNSHLSGIVRLIFTLNGKLVASASEDNTIKLWNVAAGALIRTFDCGPHFYLSALVFSPDGKFLAWRGIGQTFDLWDIELEELRRINHTQREQIRDLIFSPDGTLMVSTFSDVTIEIWATKSGALQQTLKGHSDQVWSLKFSIDGRHLASASRDNTVKLWNVSTWLLQETLKGHSDWINGIVFSPDSSLIVSASNDWTVKIWRRQITSFQNTIEGHSSTIRGIVFSPENSLAASASADGTIKTWDMDRGVLLGTIECGSDVVNTLAFSPDCKIIGSKVGRDTVMLWDASTGTPIRALENHCDPGKDTLSLSLADWMNTLAFSPDNRLVAAALSDYTVKIWDLRVGTLQIALPKHSAAVGAIVFSPDGKFIASTTRDLLSRSILDSDQNTIKLWHTWTGSLKHKLRGHSDSIGALVFSPDGKLMASASSDYTVKLWDVARGHMIQSFDLDYGSFTYRISSPYERSFRLPCEREFRFTSDQSRLLPGNWPVSGEQYEASIAQIKAQPTFDFDRTGEWICWNKKPILHLPLDVRSRIFGIRGNTFLLGAGRMTLLSFKPFLEMPTI